MTSTAAPTSRVSYGNLSRRVRETIKFWYGDPVTIAGYVRYWFDNGVWRGDSCGCPDDRCIGFHHDRPEDCHCLESTLSEYAVWAIGCPGCEQVVTRYADDAVQVYDPNRLVLVWWHRHCHGSPQPSGK